MQIFAQREWLIHSFFFNKQATSDKMYTFLQIRLLFWGWKLNKSSKELDMYKQIPQTSITIVENMDSEGSAKVKSASVEWKLHAE